MSTAPFTVWCNASFPEPALTELRRGLGEHRLVLASDLTQSNLQEASPDPLLESTDIALGQPDVRQLIDLPRLKWVHLTTAGYTRYDRDDVKAALLARGAALTNSSTVYAEPCAEHVFAMMLALARQLPQCWAEQAGDRAWRQAEHRIRSRLLVGQNVLLLGFGAIARRLAELLAPFRMNVTAVRRHAGAQGAVQVVTLDRLDALLPWADHVVNVLPANVTTDRFLDAPRIGLLKPKAIVYNIGRGTTVDHDALFGRAAGASHCRRLS